MKNFFRSVPGKTIAFLAFILSVCVIIASVGTVLIAFYGTGVNLYTHAEQDALSELHERTFHSQGYGIMWEVFHDNYGENYIDSNYYLRIQDSDGHIVWESMDAASAKNWPLSYQYGVQRNASGEAIDVIRKEDNFRLDESWDIYTINMEIKEGSSAETELNLFTTLIHTVYTLRYAVYGIGIAAVILAIASFITLMSAAGHRPGTDELFPGVVNEVPYDLMFTAFGMMVVLSILFLDQFYGYILFLLIAVFFLIETGIGLVLCMGAASSIKQHMFIKNTLIYRFNKLALRILSLLWRGVKKLNAFNLGLIRNIPLVWKTGLGFIGIYLFEMIIAFSARDGGAAVGLTLEKMVLIPAGLYVAICLRKLQKGGVALARGDLSHITDTKGMFWDLKTHGENLNSIASGMAIAVEERTKSERMKTELITNVSHDIKTPLTSIINYAALIGEEPCENPKITEYADVLVRQSERMKRLIEDLVEASKASTGNLDVNLAPCDAATFVMQAAGEYEDKLNQAELTLITKHPEKDIRILADGRRMWRVFDNLMNNICKYAQSGTRVYLSLEQVGGNAVFTFKNTSREALDMTEEELMERFTRGDSSRNTEGNGLGLSIAKSMAELQNGSLQLSIDGDLFKAILSFPVV